MKILSLSFAFWSCKDKLLDKIHFVPLFNQSYTFRAMLLRGEAGLSIPLVDLQIWRNPAITQWLDSSRVQ